MFEKKEPTFSIQIEKQCDFCKKLINYETRICPFCEQELLGNFGPYQQKMSEGWQSSEQTNEERATSANKNKEDLKSENENFEFEGLKGWLILIGIGLLISPIKSLISVSKIYAPYFEPGVLESLTSEDSPNFIPYFKGLFILESVYNFLLILFSFYLIYLFFSKSKFFPMAYISCLLISLIFIPLDASVTSLILPNIESFDKDTIKEFSQLLLQAVIWIPYLLKSKRVRFTFVR
jgi:hypothetical protein